MSAPFHSAGSSLPERILRAAEAHCAAVLCAMVAFGFVLRVALLLLAENRLDADEATVAVMALDLQEGGALPFFFTGQAYNGGAALEAWAAAALFGVVGPSALGLKGVVAAEWLASAALFAALCRNALPARTGLFAVLFFSVGTPFLLEWSVKARGGYAETLLFSTALLWLAAPRAESGAAPTWRALGFGALAGIGLWASEMLLLMIPCAALWGLLGTAPTQRLRLASLGAAGFATAQLPLLLYNATHDWQNYASSALASSLGESAVAPLSGSLLAGSLAFVLGPTAGLLGMGFSLGAFRIARRRPIGLQHALLLHALLYVFAFWLSGTRFLPGIAPSRVLFAVTPSLAIVLASAACFSERDSALRGWLAGVATALWLGATLIGAASWAASGAPRETGSWRASWALVDAKGLHRALTERDIDQVLVSYWTRWPLEFTARAETQASATPPMTVSMSPRSVSASPRVAYALRVGTPLLAALEEAFFNKA